METTRPGSGGGIVDVRLLGPVEVAGPDGPAMLPGSRQRALVGLLALRPGVIVPRSSLVDALWGEEPPRTAVKTLYSHVTRVRQAMEACGLPDLLATREPGYALRLALADVDAHRFADHVRQASAAGSSVETAAHLRTALELWRGDAFADTPLAGWGAAEVDRLHEARLTATEDLWEAELELGQHRRAAAELEPLVARHPYRERLVGLLMLARYRSGRHAEALDAYHRMRTRLADELGVDPGPELQRRYAAILRHDPELDDHATVKPVAASLLPRPAQLPAQVGHFTGRVQELSELDRVVDGPIRIVAISGAAGMGKTSLALHWAHRIKDRFGDGQLFLDLRGHEPGGDTAMTATEALPHLLRSLGVPPDRVPADLSEQAGMYRSLLHDKRLLIVLDNCGGVDQVLPLIPGADNSLLVVTSRSQLTALATRHAVHLVGLDSLEQPEALALLRRVLGHSRVEREASAAAELVELCDGMPLALRIAAALLAARPRQPIGELTAGLATENRLDALAIEGDTRSLRAVFASAYHAVSAPAARLFRLLGLHPGRTISGRLAAAVLAADAHDLLAELVAAHLITDIGNGRYRFHDLLRLYAAECAQRDEPAAVRAESADRIMDWYLAVAEAASRLLDRQRDRVAPKLRYPPADPPKFTDHDSVLDFLEGERSNLVPLVRYATEHEHTTAAWQLTYLLAGFFRFRGHWADRIEICRWAITAAQGDGDPLAESLMHSSLGVAYNAAHRFADALEPLQRSLSLAHAIGDKRGQGNAHHNLAGAYAGLRRYDEAIDSFQQALALFTATGQTVPMALMLNNIGEIYARTGQTELGFEHLARGLALAHELGDPWLEAAITHSIGQAHLRGGNIEDAESYLRQALDTRRRVGDHRFAAETLTYLGVAHLARDDAAAAIGVLLEAVATCREVADEHLEATALNHLGEAYLRSGDLAAADEPLRLALALRARLPDPDEEAQIQDHLGELRRLRASPGKPEEGGGLPPAATPRPTIANRSRRPG